VKLENKIAQKNVEVFDMEKYYPKPGDIVEFDIKPYLFKELILKEDDFRQSIESIDWSVYAHKEVVVFCSNKAIIPIWAYMIIAARLSAVDTGVHSQRDNLEEIILIERLKKIDLSPFKEERIIIKGCSNKNLSPLAYMRITALFRPVAKAISFGEACSTVPIFRP
jgi:hypothetical protein